MMMLLAAHKLVNLSKCLPNKYHQGRITQLYCLARGDLDSAQSKSELVHTIF